MHPSVYQQLQIAHQRGVKARKIRDIKDLIAETKLLMDMDPEVSDYEGMAESYWIDLLIAHEIGLSDDAEEMMDERFQNNEPVKLLEDDFYYAPSVRPLFNHLKEQLQASAKDFGDGFCYRPTLSQMIAYYLASRTVYLQNVDFNGEPCDALFFIRQFGIGGEFDDVPFDMYIVKATMFVDGAEVGSVQGDLHFSQYQLNKMSESEYVLSMDRFSDRDADFASCMVGALNNAYFPLNSLPEVYGLNSSQMAFKAVLRWVSGSLTEDGKTRGIALPELLSALSDFVVANTENLILASTESPGYGCLPFDDQEWPEDWDHVMEKICAISEEEDNPIPPIEIGLIACVSELARIPWLKQLPDDSGDFDLQGKIDSIKQNHDLFSKFIALKQAEPDPVTPEATYLMLSLDEDRDPDPDIRMGDVVASLNKKDLS